MIKCNKIGSSYSFYTFLHGLEGVISLQAQDIEGQNQKILFCEI